MSYILEALKKIERKREQQESPKLLLAGGVPEKEPRKRPFWPYPVIAALLLNAGILIWWIGLPGSEKKETPSKPPALSRTETVASPKAEPVRQKTRENPKKDSPVKIPAPSPKLPVTQEIKKEALPRPEKTQPLEPVKTAPPPAPLKKEVIRTDKVFPVNELPAVIKNALPPFKVSAHVYSTDPQNRMSRINDQIFKEGQEMSEGLKVEEIIPGGIILAYKGYRFRIGIKE